MRYDTSATPTTVAQISQSVNQCLERLLQKRQLDDAAHDDFAAVRCILEAMPLPTDLYGLALYTSEERSALPALHRAGCGMVRTATAGQ